jgi:hypothetical protein
MFARSILAHLFVELRSVPLRIGNFETHWVLVVMDQFTRRIIGFWRTVA